MSMKFCKRCLYSTEHPLGLTIDHEGVCSGCRVHEEKDKLDWEERWERLKTIVAPYKNKAKNNYDCVVPVTGAQDSYYIVHVVKNKLGLNPLLVSYNKYYNTQIGIRNLANLRIQFNCDILYQNVNPVSVKKIVRRTLNLLGSINWPNIAGHTVFPVQTAVRFEIPLIIWGAHQGLEQVGMYSHLEEVEMTRRYRKDHDLMGHEAEDLLSTFDTLNEEDVWQYEYPDDTLLEKYGIRGLYLGNYIRWDPKKQHEEMISAYNYKTAKTSRTFETYENIDCYNYLDLHDQLKLYKHGYSKVTDHASREIRHKRLSRNEGIFLVKSYEQNQIKYKDLFCQWLGIHSRSLDFITDQHRNKKYWRKDIQNNWKFQGWSSMQEYQPDERFNKLGNEPFINNSNLTMGKNRSYITIGRGWPD